MAKVFKLKKVTKIPALPAYAVEITSRPGKPAHDFMIRNGAKIYVAVKGTALYFVQYRSKVYRISYNGMPSGLVKDEDFKEWFKQIKK